MIDFTDQVAVVTAGRGLGRLYALDLARRGASVVVNDLGSTMHGDGSDDSVADQVVEEIIGDGGQVCDRRGISAMPGNAEVPFPEHDPRDR